MINQRRVMLILQKVMSVLKNGFDFILFSYLKIKTKYEQ